MNTPSNAIDSHHENTLSHIPGPNLEHIQAAKPHRLYANNMAERLEIYCDYVPLLLWEDRDRWGLIVWVKRSWGARGWKIEIYCIDDAGQIFTPDQFGWLHPSHMDMQIFYMLMYPHAELDGWILWDVAATKKEEIPMSTWFSFWIKTDWGKTETFHPDLEHTMSAIVSRIREIV